MRYLDHSIVLSFQWNVLDNIDKTMKPNDMRIDNQTKPLHYVHTYAVLDRVDMSCFDDKLCRPDIGNIHEHLGSMLPKKQDSEIQAVEWQRG